MNATIRFTAILTAFCDRFSSRQSRPNLFLDLMHHSVKLEQYSCLECMLFGSVFVESVEYHITASVSNSCKPEAREKYKFTSNSSH